MIEEDRKPDALSGHTVYSICESGVMASLGYVKYGKVTYRECSGEQKEVQTARLGQYVRKSRMSTSKGGS